MSVTSSSTANSRLMSMTTHGIPASLMCKNGILQFSLSWDERNGPVQWNVVDPPVPDSSIDHSVRGECKEGTNDSTSEAVIPIVEFINGESACDEGCSKDRCVDGNKFPHGRVMVREEF